MCKQLIGYIDTHEKNMIFFHVLLRLFSGPEILMFNTTVYVMIINASHLFCLCDRVKTTLINMVSRLR